MRLMTWTCMSLRGQAPAATSFSVTVGTLPPETGPHSFRVTPVARPCALVGPIVPSQTSDTPSHLSVAAVSTDSVTLAWIIPGCPSTCLDVDAYQVSVGTCSDPSLRSAVDVRSCRLTGSLETLAVLSPLDAECLYRLQSSDVDCRFQVSGLQQDVPYLFAVSARLSTSDTFGAQSSTVAAPIAIAQLTSSRPQVRTDTSNSFIYLVCIRPTKPDIAMFCLYGTHCVVLLNLTRFPSGA
jgi:hypothetical protein